MRVTAHSGEELLLTIMQRLSHGSGQRRKVDSIVYSIVHILLYYIDVNALLRLLAQRMSR